MSNVNYQMPKFNKVKVLLERTSGAPPVIFIRVLGLNSCINILYNDMLENGLLNQPNAQISLIVYTSFKQLCSLKGIKSAMLLSNNISCPREEPIQRYERDKHLCALIYFFTNVQMRKF